MKYIKIFENKEIDWEDFDYDEVPDIPEEFENHEDFYEFLVENYLLDKWIYNTKNNVGNHYLNRCNGDIKLFLRDTKERDFIMNAFVWSNTKNGQAYWNNLNNQWIFRLYL
jgi:hypothetical protein